MKGSTIIAATALSGLAHAGKHAMKLKKVPLSEQLVSPATPCDMHLSSEQY